MTRFDLAPLYRSTVGFDRLAHVMDRAFQASDAGTNGNGFPPYNIEVVEENLYRITLAIAGFASDDVSLEVHDQTLTITGKQPEVSAGEYLYHSIANASFTQKFQLADHVEVTAANMENGLLTIDLERRVPEALKPRTIEINSGAPKSLSEKAKKLVSGTKTKAA